MLLMVDDHSRFMWIEVIKSKDEAFKRFKRVKALAEATPGRRLMAFRSDRGGEFNSAAFREYCDEHGIKHCTTAPYTQLQNSVVERRNQTVVEMARCLLKSMGVPAGAYPRWARGCHRTPGRKMFYLYIYSPYTVGTPRNFITWTLVQQAGPFNNYQYEYH